MILRVSFIFSLAAASFSAKATAVDSTRRKICSASPVEDFLRITGLSSSNVEKYAELFKRHDIELPELLRLSLPELQELGVAPYGNAAKISAISSQDTDQCAGSSPCQHGGICRDGFNCFYCMCNSDKGFYGPRCELPCRCKNSARCLSTVTGFQCVCQPGWRGELCDEQWLDEQVFLDLKNLVTQQQAELVLLKEKATCNHSEILKKMTESEAFLNLNRVVSEQQQELTVLKNNLKAMTTMVGGHKETLDKLTKAEGWRLTRVDAVFPKLAKFQTHQLTPTYVEKSPVRLPNNTRALIISVFCNFWNRNGHAYMEFDVYQKGFQSGGKASAPNVHFNVYANTFYYEIMIPWDSSLGDEIVFKLTNTYFTGGIENWYKVKLVGYVTA